MTKVNIARTYRDKYGADMPTMKLARILYRDNNLLFKDVENATLYEDNRPLCW